MSSASVALTRGRHADGAKHKTGYDSRWEAAYTWVFYVEGEGMYCKLCRKFDTKNRQNQSKVWNKEACTTIRKDVLTKHEASIMHREALEQERACQVVKVRGGIKEAMQEQVVLQERCCDWCNEVLVLAVQTRDSSPPTTHLYEPLLSLAMNLGCTYLSALKVGGNAHYTSERIVQELVQLLAQQIEDAQLKAVNCSMFYGLMIDESTDISVTKQLVLYGRYVSETCR